MRDSWLASTLRSRAGLLQWASIALTIAFVAWILVSRGEDLRAALTLTPTLFIAISLSAFGTFFVNGLELQVLAARFGNRIPLRDAMMLGLLVNTLNYLPMKTGTMLNGVILRVRYQLKLSDFAALVAGSTVIHLWIAMLLAGGALLLEGRMGLGALFAAASTLVVVLLVVWGRARSGGRFDEHSSKIVRTAWRVVDGIGLIFASPRLLAIETAINIALILLATLRMQWGFQALSAPVSFMEALVATSVGIFAARLSVIPGGMGFKEGGAAAGAAMAGVDAGLGLAASVIDRAVTLVWLLILGVPASLYLQRVTGVHLSEARSMSTGEDRPEA